MPKARSLVSLHARQPWFEWDEGEREGEDGGMGMKKGTTGQDAEHKEQWKVEKEVWSAKQGSTVLCHGASRTGRRSAALARVACEQIHQGIRFFSASFPLGSFLSSDQAKDDILDFILCCAVSFYLAGYFFNWQIDVQPLRLVPSRAQSSIIRSPLGFVSEYTA